MCWTKCTRRDFLRIAGRGAAAMALPSPAHSRPRSGSRPNIIFVLADDLGWAELACYGNNFNETPNLDDLARHGMRFSQAYAAAPVCSPYRAALLTGQYPARVGITDYLRPTHKPFSTQHLTGYRYHGAKIETRPKDHGFDEELICEVKGVGNGANFYPYKFRDQPVTWLNVTEKRLPGNEFLVDRMNLEAVEFIERHKDHPFFLYLSHYATHTILHGKEELAEKYRTKHRPGESSRNKCYICRDAGLDGDPRNHWAKHHNPHLAAMLESIDDGVGMIARKLDQLNLTDNTIIVFTSDNGGETNVTSNAPLRGGKSQLYEGGIRVPLIIRWPARVPGNSLCRAPTVNTDFYPTFLAASGIQLDPKQHLDGVSILSILQNPRASLQRNTFYWHYPLQKPHFLGGRSSGAIRKGHWKLIEFYDIGQIELYNIAEDIGEERNLKDSRTEKAGELLTLLRNWRKKTLRDYRRQGLRIVHL
jgi:arylsulfatase A-like enzyme